MSRSVPSRALAVALAALVAAPGRGSAQVVEVNAAAGVRSPSGVQVQTGVQPLSLNASGLTLGSSLPGGRLSASLGTLSPERGLAPSAGASLALRPGAAAAAPLAAPSPAAAENVLAPSAAIKDTGREIAEIGREVGEHVAAARGASATDAGAFGSIGRAFAALTGVRTRAVSGLLAEPAAVQETALRPGLAKPAPYAAHDAIKAMDLSAASFVVLDFELSSFMPYAEVSRPTEVGAVKFKITEKGEIDVVGTFSTKVDPGLPVDVLVTRLNGMTPGDLKGKPAVKSVLPGLVEFLGGDSVVLAHNAPFDVSILAYQLREHGMALPKNLVIDTKALAASAFPGLKSYSVAPLAQLWNLGEQDHRGLPDAMKVAGIFLRGARQVAATNPAARTTVGDVAARAEAANFETIFEAMAPKAVGPENRRPMPADFYAETRRVGDEMHHKRQPKMLRDLAYAMGLDYDQVLAAMRKTHAEVEVSKADDILASLETRAPTGVILDLSAVMAPDGYIPVGLSERLERFLRAGVPVSIMDVPFDLRQRLEAQVHHSYRANLYFGHQGHWGRDHGFYKSPLHIAGPGQTAFAGGRTISSDLKAALPEGVERFDIQGYEGTERLLAAAARGVYASRPSSLYYPYAKPEPQGYFRESVRYRLVRAALRLVDVVWGWRFSAPAMGSPIETVLLNDVLPYKRAVFTDFDDTLAKRNTVLPANKDVSDAELNQVVTVEDLIAARRAGKEVLVSTDRGRESRPGSESLTIFQSLEKIPRHLRAGMWVSSDGGGYLYRYDKSGEPELMQSIPDMSAKLKAALVSANVQAQGIARTYTDAYDKPESLTEVYGPFSYFLNFGGKDAAGAWSMSREELRVVADVYQDALDRAGLPYQVQARIPRDPHNAPYLTYSTVDKSISAKFVVKALGLKVEDVFSIGDSSYYPRRGRAWLPFSGWARRWAERLSGAPMPETGNDTDRNLEKALPGMLSLGVGLGLDPNMSEGYRFAEMGPAATKRALLAFASKQYRAPAPPQVTGLDVIRFLIGAAFIVGFLFALAYGMAYIFSNIAAQAPLNPGFPGDVDIQNFFGHPR